MKIVFWGTPNFSIPTLESLISNDYQVIAVVTQPDRKRARGNKLVQSPVKQVAIKHGLNVFTPSNIKTQESIRREIIKLNADIYIVVAFGQILPKEVLLAPPKGSWNGHASLLPRWRGAAPIQRSILNGDEVTGVGIMAMEEGLDTGPVLMQKEIPIHQEDNSFSLSKKLSILTAELILKALPQIEKVECVEEKDRYQVLGLIPQTKLNQSPSYAKQIRREELLIDWNKSASFLNRQIKAFYPNTNTKFSSKRVKIQSAEISKESNVDYRPGKIIKNIPNFGVLVSTGNGSIIIKSIRIEGKVTTEGDALIQQLGSYNCDQFE